MKFRFSFLIFIFSFLTLSAQELPQGYFRNPLDSPIALSAIFAEFRNNHFHSGLDMRTGGEENRPVYAAADGYVAKVSISPWGGGKILYIKHPNGYTTVYMHLNGYAGEIGKAVLKEQYARQSYSIEKLFAPGELPVKKGQLVARSGSTGGSGGPHLHFEVRRGGEEDLHTHATTINPLLFGFPYTDNIKPIIRGIRLYRVSSESGVRSSESSGRSNINSELITPNSELTVDGPFYLGIYATDAAEGSTPKNGVDRVEVYLDGTLFFMYTTEELPLDSLRMDNALIDYPLYASSRQAYLLTRMLPGAEGPWVPVCMGDGIFRLKPGTTHHIGIKVYDIRDNCAEQTLTVKVSSESGVRSSELMSPHPDNSELRSPNSELVKYDQPYSIQYSTFNVRLAPFTLYADDILSAKAEQQPGKVPTVSIMPKVNNIPPHRPYTLGIMADPSLFHGVPTDKIVVVRVVGDKLTACRTTSLQRGLFSAQVREWGRFTLAADTVAPTVRPINFSEGKPLKTNVLKIKIGDNLSGIETYNCYLNGCWILAEYDGKTATLVISADGKLKAGSNTLVCEVTDAVGNRTRRQWSLTK